VQWTIRDVSQRCDTIRIAILPFDWALIGQGAMTILADTLEVQVCACTEAATLGATETIFERVEVILHLTVEVRRAVA
jgi:hypothetical protein